MATKVEKNWLNRLRKTLTAVTDEDVMDNMEHHSDELRAALHREMSKKLMDKRYAGLVYRNMVV